MVTFRLQRPEIILESLPAHTAAAATAADRQIDDAGIDGGCAAAIAAAAADALRQHRRGAQAGGQHHWSRIAGITGRHLDDGGTASPAGAAGTADRNGKADRGRVCVAAIATTAADALRHQGRGVGAGRGDRRRSAAGRQVDGGVATRSTGSTVAALGVDDAVGAAGAAAFAADALREQPCRRSPSHDDLGALRIHFHGTAVAGGAAFAGIGITIAAVGGAPVAARTAGAEAEPGRNQAVVRGRRRAGGRGAGQELQLHIAAVATRAAIATIGAADLVGRVGASPPVGTP